MFTRLSESLGATDPSLASWVLHGWVPVSLAVLPLARARLCARRAADRDATADAAPARLRAHRRRHGRIAVRALRDALLHRRGRFRLLGRTTQTCGCQSRWKFPGALGKGVRSPRCQTRVDSLSAFSGSLGSLKRFPPTASGEQERARRRRPVARRPSRIAGLLLFRATLLRTAAAPPQGGPFGVACRRPVITIGTDDAQDARRIERAPRAQAPARGGRPVERRRGHGGPAALAARRGGRPGPPAHTPCATAALPLADPRLPLVLAGHDAALKTGKA